MTYYFLGVSESSTELVTVLVVVVVVFVVVVVPVEGAVSELIVPADGATTGVPVAERESMTLCGLACGATGSALKGNPPVSHANKSQPKRTHATASAESHIPLADVVSRISWGGMASICSSIP